jgi:hypothetical protein
MKEQLTGYVRPTIAEFEYLWHNSLIVLDTNSLFIPYRSKPETCERVFRTLEKFSDRLWIPFQVMLEFRKDYLDVISEQKSAYQDIINTLNSNEKKISGEISKYSRHKFIDTKLIEDQIGKSFSDIIDHLNKGDNQHPDFRTDDPILDRLMILYNGKVGPEYPTERLQQIFNEGKVRYDSKIPPGYKDIDKKTDLERYGDLIIWYQIIDHAKSTRMPIIFVTNDDKRDWWWKDNKGKTYLPKHELTTEIKDKADVSFYMYSSDGFLQHAQEYLHEKVDQSAVAEIRDIRMDASIAEARRDKDVRIEANKDSFVIGHSITFAGNSFAIDSFVRLIVFGPGKYTEGIEIATPVVSRSHNWIHSWTPELNLDPGYYTIVVYDSQKHISDEVTVIAQKGSIAIVVKGNQSYFIGEEIKILGTSTVSYNVFLTIVGPEPSNEVRKLDSFSLSKNGNESSFVRVDVMGDNTWSYIWDTSKVGTSLKAGIYTIYAIQGPFTPDNINDKIFGTVSIIVKKPFVSATVSQSSFAKGDSIYITGTAEGTPRQKLQVWIVGNSFFYHEIIRANADASFVLKLPSATMKTLPEGKYFGIIQHPMMNNEFDVLLDTDKKSVLIKHPTKTTRLFSLEGSDCLRGEKALVELIAAMNSPDIDDIFTKIMFIVEKPVINFDPIGTKHVGDKFTISAQTNLAVDDEIKIVVFSSTDNSSQKNAGQFSGATGVIKVLRGDSGLNKISFDIDISGFQSDEYIVRASAISIEVVGEIKFQIM